MDIIGSKGKKVFLEGSSGGGGLLVSGSSVFNEDPTGTKNGINRVFSTAQPFVAGSTQVYHRGLRMKLGPTKDYTETSSNQITFNFNIYATDELIIDYITT